jgi:hypothetical protein
MGSKEHRRSTKSIKISRVSEREIIKEREREREREGGRERESERENQGW